MERESRGDAVPTAPLHPRIKNRSASPIRILSPQPRSCVVPAYPCGMLRSLRNTDTVHYRHGNTHSALIQTDNTPRHIAHRDPRRCEKINQNRWRYNREKWVRIVYLILSIHINRIIHILNHPVKKFSYINIYNCI